MATWRTYSLDVMTGERVAELVLADLKFSEELNKGGTASGTLKLPSLERPRTVEAYLDISTEDGNPIYLEADGAVATAPDPAPTAIRARAAKLVDAVEPNRRQLVIERDGVVVWAGIITSAPYDDATEEIKVSAVTDQYLLRRRIIDRKHVFTNADQLYVVRQLVNTALAVTGGDIRLTVGTETSGVLVTRTYERYQLEQVGAAIDKLAETDTGFDWAIDYAWDPDSGELTKTLRLSYPRRGRGWQQSGWVFRLGRNFDRGSFTWPNDGSRQFTKIWGIGAGSEDSMLISSAVDANLIRPLASGGAGYPLMETTVSWKDIESQSLLNGLTRAQLAAYAKPVALPEVTINGDVRPVFGSYIVGDACQLVIPPNESPRFPDGLTTYRRIVGWSVDVGDAGEASVKLTLGEEPGA